MKQLEMTGNDQHPGSGYRVLAINRLLALFVFPAAYMYLLEDDDKPIKLRRRGNRCWWGLCC